MTERLIAARALLTPYVRAVDLLEGHDAAMRRRATDPLALPGAPHRRWVKQNKAESEQEEDAWDQDALAAAERLVGGDASGRVDVRSGKTRRYTPPGWPLHVTYGSEEWYQLRWRPAWRLDQGQKWMDRFELGAYWWHAIYADPRFPTERRFEDWRNDIKSGHRGVIWAAPTPDGRLEEPALAVVVVSSTRWPRRTARWPLLLPNPAWRPDLRASYVVRRGGDRAGEGWAALAAELDALASGDAVSLKSLAQQSLHARIDARSKRR